MTQLVSKPRGKSNENPARRLRFISREYQVPPILYNQVSIANIKCRTNLASKNVIYGIHYQSFLPLRTSFMSSNVIADFSHMPRKIPSDKTKRLVGVSNS